MVIKSKAKAKSPNRPNQTAIDELLLEEASAPAAVTAADLKGITVQAAALADVRSQLVKNASELERLKKLEFTLVSVTLPAMMDAAGKVRALTLEDGSQIERSQAVYTSISQENAQSATAWLIKNGYGAIVKTTIAIKLEKGDAKSRKAAESALRKAKIPYESRSGVHAQTLAAFGRESVERGRELPETIKVHIVPIVKLTPPKD